MNKGGPNLIVIPAIDIKNGRCVRLKQGQFSKETVFSECPEEMASKWVEQGAKRIHLVDLDGAYQGRPVNEAVIRRIIDAVPVPIQLGGGIRERHSLESYFSLGVDYLILGTVAQKDPDLVAWACERYPGQILLGIDARKNRVALEGWTEEVDLSPVDLAKSFENVGVTAIIYTDILRDGMKAGPNVAATRTLAQAIEIPVIASGGISTTSDVLEVVALSEYGVEGMITGRALYDGSLELPDAIRVVERKIYG